MDTRQIDVTGRVQGVGYRDALRREARRLGVTGWVRNRGDGSVEAVVQGSPQAVEAIIAWARRGPPAALVAAVRTGPPTAEFDRSYSTFELWPTA
ncbi:MAG TPA: acylphosphatase [Burkholderiales bacterium]|nr:acylphosphatase [Burkholderiales bacterium]